MDDSMGEVRTWWDDNGGDDSDEELPAGKKWRALQVPGGGPKAGVGAHAHTHTHTHIH